jgi:hypothetical protein
MPPPPAPAMAWVDAACGAGCGGSSAQPGRARLAAGCSYSQSGHHHGAQAGKAAGGRGLVHARLATRTVCMLLTPSQACSMLMQVAMICNAGLLWCRVPAASTPPAAWKATTFECSCFTLVVGRLSVLNVCAHVFQNAMRWSAPLLMMGCKAWTSRLAGAL